MRRCKQDLVFPTMVLPEALTCPALPGPRGGLCLVPRFPKGHLSWGKKKFPFCNKPAGEGDVFPQPSFQAKGRQSDTVIRSHSHPKHPHGAKRGQSVGSGPWGGNEWSECCQGADGGDEGQAGAASRT